MIIMIALLWSLVGAALILFQDYITDKPKIQQENQQFLTMSEAQSGLKNFIDSSSKIMQTSSQLLPKP